MQPSTPAGTGATQPDTCPQRACRPPDRLDDYVRHQFM